MLLVVAGLQWAMQVPQTVTFRRPGPVPARWSQHSRFPSTSLCRMGQEGGCPFTTQGPTKEDGAPGRRPQRSAQPIPVYPALTCMLLPEMIFISWMKKYTSVVYPSILDVLKKVFLNFSKHIFTFLEGSVYRI